MYNNYFLKSNIDVKQFKNIQYNSVTLINKKINPDNKIYLFELSNEKLLYINHFKNIYFIGFVDKNQHRVTTYRSDVISIDIKDCKYQYHDNKYLFSSDNDYLFSFDDQNLQVNVHKGNQIIPLPLYHYPSTIKLNSSISYSLILACIFFIILSICCIIIKSFFKSTDNIAIKFIKENDEYYYTYNIFSIINIFMILFLSISFIFCLKILEQLNSTNIYTYIFGSIISILLILFLIQSIYNLN